MPGMFRESQSIIYTAYTGLRLESGAAKLDTDAAAPTSFVREEVELDGVDAQ